MSLLLPFIIGPAPQIADLPPPFANLALLNSICAGVLVLCLLGLRPVRNQLTSRLPSIALFSTLGLAAIMGGVNVFYARTAHATLMPWPSHLRPLGSFSYAATYSTPYTILYGCTAIIICATVLQIMSTVVILLRYARTKKPALT
jgi:hypothetical protein